METTGRSVQEAKEKALDELGVDEVDAEFEVIAEAQTGLFGRLRSEARVRARVRPSVPRAKEERRNRDRKRRSSGAGNAAGSETAKSESSKPDGSRSDSSRSESSRSESSQRDSSRSESSRSEPATAGAGKSARPPAARNDGEGPAVGGAEPTADAGPADADAADSETRAEGTGNRNRNRNRRRRSGGRPGAVPSDAERAQAERGERPDRATGDRFDDEDESAKGTEVEVDLERQAEVAVDFLTKLTAEFGLEATVNVARPDEDTVEVQLTGPDLGILIGPKGATLVAVQNLTRTVVF
ncbi:MAG TPA: Jag N-terminal domain-containing protein, partial [Acidimicrobiales bacterium]|nr:Jag N-terminal domain-containing protein [Acidimicrobiales bacterium]